MLKKNQKKIPKAFKKFKKIFWSLKNISGQFIEPKKIPNNSKFEKNFKKTPEKL